jgi:hypothetical protein
MVARTRVVVLVALVAAGCRPAAPGGGGPAPAEEPDAPAAGAIADPVLRRAREQADATLGGLLAGTLDADPDLAPAAKKLKGYQSYAVKSQTLVREGAAEFGGVLTGPKGRARFRMTLFEQAAGGWAVGAFSGPDPE